MENIIYNNQLDLQVLKKYLVKPAIFEKSTDKFWDDEHISAQMLECHLNPDIEAASKTRDTIAAETSFIIQITNMNNSKAVLDLGCGPGLYVKEFAQTGAQVTGIDLSPRSINYANTMINPGSEKVNFINMNYLDLDFKALFNVVTMIFYDFCVLSPEEQSQLLTRIHDALKPNGFFIFDIVNTNMKTSAGTSISISEGGFWSPGPYLEIFQTYIYEEPKTEGRQYIIIGENGATRVVRLYHRLFSLEEITKLLNDHNFRVEAVYNNLQGKPLSDNAETFGIVARKA